jgi:hypothetical protein
MRRVLLFVFGLLAAGGAIAQSESIYLCVDEEGHKTYQNLGNGKGCRRVDGLVATVPGPAPTRAAPNAPSELRGVSPASFPRVDGDTQRLRDGDRKRILEEELRTEQERLTRLRADFNNGQPAPSADESPGSQRYQEHVQHLLEDIQRSENNIASLRRELAPPRY